MTTFDDREKAFEAKYRLDQETAFKVMVRRDKLFGLWAAGLLGLDGAEATTYAKTVIDTELGAGDHDVVHKVAKDFDERGVAIDASRLRKTLDALHETAREQIMAEFVK